MSFGDKRLDAAADRFITGNYGEDQFTESDCPMCGEGDLTEEEAEAISSDMEFDEKTCVKCGMTFWELREELFDDE